jgi:hypothetical protein
MKNSFLWTVALMLVAGLLLAACAPAVEAPGKIQPVVVEPIEGTGLNRLTLTERAAERLGIQTAPVREEPVSRTRTVGGKVVASPVASAAITAPISGVVSAPVGVAIPVTGTHLSAGQTILRVSPNVVADKGEPFVDLHVLGDSDAAVACRTRPDSRSSSCFRGRRPQPGLGARGPH